MKKITTLIFILISLKAFANERGADRKELRERENDRVELSSQNSDYIPAHTKEISRELFAKEHRQDDREIPSRFKEGRIAKSLNAKTSKKEMTISEISDSIWDEASEGNESMIYLEDNMIRHTFIWYLMQDYNSSSNLQKQEKVKRIQKILTQ